MEIRDPVLGPIPVLEEERRLIDHPLFQRLRRIKQLGLCEVPFPGATHTRFLHSLGVMHLAGLAFDAVFRDYAPAGDHEHERLRRLVRLAGLLHDVGHFPMSHSMEEVMPARAALPLPGTAGDTTRACHEDYTQLVLHASDLADELDRHHAGWELTAQDVAAVLDLRVAHDGAGFRWRGQDVRRVLHQLVASELDADRMDYLLRDAFYSGVSYGHFDRGWLLSNLTRHEADDGLHMALQSRAVFTFDHYLLARYHMFLTVYFHHRSVALERMLAMTFGEAPEPVAFPSRADDLLTFDDGWLRQRLLDEPGRWGRRILAGDAPRMLLEVSGEHSAPRAEHQIAHLRARGVEPIVVESRGSLSKYYRNRSPVGIFVKRPFDGSGAIRLEDATDLFKRYTEPVSIVRIYGDEPRGGSARGEPFRLHMGQST